MKICFTKQSFYEYQHWANTDKRVLKKINSLIRAIEASPFDGEGKPEALKFGYSGYWSRRITHEHRLVYKVENQTIYIAQCLKHY